MRKIKIKPLILQTYFQVLFYFPVEEGTSSIFAGSCFEVIKSQYLGKHGHIAIATNDIHRAIAYLKIKDISVLPKNC